MKKILFFMILFSWIVLLSCATQQKAIQPAYILPEKYCDAPVWNVGDSWRFGNEDKIGEWMMVERIEKDEYILGTTGDQYKRCLEKKTLASKAFITPDGKRNQTGDTLLYFDFPLYVTKKWSMKHKSTPSFHGGGFNYLSEYEVISYEDTKVYAGIFKAFKIELKQTSLTSLSGPRKAYIWYSSEVKNMIKFTCEKPTDWGKDYKDLQFMQLISFKLKDK